jgi:hypothetical protein
MKTKCTDCPQKDAIGQLPEYNRDNYCMMAFPTDYGSDTPILVKCDKVGIVGQTLEPWYIEAFGVKP